MFAKSDVLFDHPRGCGSVTKRDIHLIDLNFLSVRFFFDAEIL